LGPEQGEHVRRKPSAALRSLADFRSRIRRDCFLMRGREVVDPRVKMCLLRGSRLVPMLESFATKDMQLRFLDVGDQWP
jgi:hypothetical protein